MLARLIGILLIMAPPTPAHPGGAYINQSLHFGFTPPAGWKQVKIRDAVVAFTGPTEHGFTVNINVFAKRVDHYSLKQYVKQSSEMAGHMKYYHIIRQRATHLGLADAWERYNRLTTQNRPIETHEVICYRDGNIIVITLAALESSFKRYDVYFNRVLASFSWLH